MLLQESFNASPGYRAGMPLSLEAGPIAVASVVTVLFGLLGATVAVLRLTRIEPLAALGGNR